MKRYALVGLMLAGCATPFGDTALEDPARDEAGESTESSAQALRGDTAFIRRLADAAGPDFELTGTAFASNARLRTLETLPDSWKARVDSARGAYRDWSDPERPFRTPVQLRVYELAREGRFVGYAVEIGVVSSWRRPSSDEEATLSDPTEGVWLYFSSSRRLVVEVPWWL